MSQVRIIVSHGDGRIDLEQSGEVIDLVSMDGRVVASAPFTLEQLIDDTVRRAKLALEIPVQS